MSLCRLVAINACLMAIPLAYAQRPPAPPQIIASAKLIFDACRMEHVYRQKWVLLVCGPKPITIFRQDLSSAFNGQTELRVIDASSGESLGVIRVPGSVGGARIFGDGDQAVLTWWDGPRLRLGTWSLRSKTLSSLPGSDGPRVGGLIVTGKNTAAGVVSAASGRSPHSIASIDLPENSIRDRVAIAGLVGDTRVNAESLIGSEDGTRLAFATDNRRVLAVVDSRTLDLVKAINAPEAWKFNYVALSEDGSLAAADLLPRGRLDLQDGIPHEIMIFHVQSGAAVGRFPIDARFGLVISAKHNLLIAPGKRLLPRGRIQAVAFLHRLSDGELLGTAAHAPLKEPRSNPWAAQMNDLYLSPDGSRLITSTGATEVIFWNLIRLQTK